MANHDSLPLDGCVNLVQRLVEDFSKWSESDMTKIPSKKIYKVASRRESNDITRSARLAALKGIKAQDLSLKKFAFDTRRVDQELKGNPRKNLQYYHRSQQYIDAEVHKRMSAFSNLLPALDEIQNKYGDQPEYFDSYAIQLHELVQRVLRVKEADLDVYRPQLDYLEQLLYARYRLSLEDLTGLSKTALEKRILSKDEKLLKRGSYLNTTSNESTPKRAGGPLTVKDGNKSNTQENLVNAIFGNNEFRRDGEKTVERTITITIRDEVMD
jgi:hypothetical protein